MPTPESFFEGHPDGLAVYRAVAARVAAIGEAEVRVTRSQIAFRRRRGFAWVWRPGHYLSSTVPAVVSIGLPRRVESARWKQVVQPSSGTWMHHLELSTADEVDDEVAGWLREAWAAAG